MKKDKMIDYFYSIKISKKENCDGKYELIHGCCELTQKITHKNIVESIDLILKKYNLDLDKYNYCFLALNRT